MTRWTALAALALVAACNRAPTPVPGEDAAAMAAAERKAVADTDAARRDAAASVAQSPAEQSLG